MQRHLATWCGRQIRLLKSEQSLELLDNYFGLNQLGEVHRSSVMFKQKRTYAITAFKSLNIFSDGKRTG